MKPSVKIEMVTPAMAEAWLGDSNRHNRSVLIARVDEYAKAMAAGEWRETHQGIGIGADGSLYDGQHRLMAIVKSGVSIRLVVMRGLQPDSQAHMDDGIPRTVRARYELSTGTKVSKDDVATLSELDRIVGQRASNQRVQVGRLGELVQLYLPILDALRPATHGYIRGVSRSANRAALVYTYPTDPAAVFLAATDLWRGAELRDNDPLLTLRNHMLVHKASNGAAQGTEDFDRTVSAVAARLDGRTLKSHLPAVRRASGSARRSTHGARPTPEHLHGRAGTAPVGWHHGPW